MSWLAICRELGPKGLKLRKGYMRGDGGERWTTYVITRTKTADPTAAVVELAAAKRERA